MIVYSLGIIVDMMYRAIRIVLYAAMFFLSFTWLIGKINAYQNRELEEFRRGIKDIDWKFHNRNIMTINTYIKGNHKIESNKRTIRGSNPCKIRISFLYPSLSFLESFLIFIPLIICHL